VHSDDRLLCCQRYIQLKPVCTRRVGPPPTTPAQATRPRTVRSERALGLD
jgi:hypothetical protein